MYYRLLAWLCGYYTLEVLNSEAAALLNLCHDNGTDVISLIYEEEHLRIAILAAEWPSLKERLEKTGMEATVSPRRGLSALFRQMLDHYFFCAGALLFSAALLLLGNIADSVTVQGTEPFRYLSAAEIRELAQECGISPGRFIPAMDFDRAEKYLRRESPFVSYAAVSRRGTQIFIEIKEKTLPDTEDMPLPPGDLVAQEEAVIEEIIVLHGEALVAAGDSVKAGQVLIAGNEQGREVAAEGIVRARVRYEGKASVPLRQEQYSESGESAYSLYICWKGQAQAVIAGCGAPPYEHFRAEDIKQKLYWYGEREMPLFLVRRVYHRQEAMQTEISAAEAAQTAKELAYAEALARLPLSGCSVISKEISVDESNPSEPAAAAVIEVIRDFGLFKPY